MAKLDFFFSILLMLWNPRKVGRNCVCVWKWEGKRKFDDFFVRAKWRIFSHCEKLSRALGLKPCSESVSLNKLVVNHTKSTLEKSQLIDWCLFFILKKKREKTDIEIRKIWSVIYFYKEVFKTMANVVMTIVKMTVINKKILNLVAG